MLDKLFKRRERGKFAVPVIPSEIVQSKQINQELNQIFTKTNAQIMQNTVSGLSVSKIIQELMTNSEFMHQLANLTCEQIIKQLTEKYDFMPTDKYKEDIANKQKYINQLDAYLQERKAINQTVENDLQQFLQETTTNINSALDIFSKNIQERILDAEQRYGIHAIKQTLLNQHQNP